MKPREAEFAKLFNNAYRYIEFAIANQFYLIAKSAGLDYRRDLRRDEAQLSARPRHSRARASRPGRACSRTRCSLLAFAQNQFSLGNAAMLVNEGLVLHVVDDLAAATISRAMTVGLLGMAFKAEIDDTRASLSYKFKQALAARAGGAHHRSVRHHRPRPPASRRGDRAKRSAHPVRAACRLPRRWTLRGKPVVDVWGVLERANVIG